jgi:hypothetical protein
MKLQRPLREGRKLASCGVSGLYWLRGGVPIRQGAADGARTWLDGGAELGRGSTEAENPLGHEYCETCRRLMPARSWGCVASWGDEPGMTGAGGNTLKCARPARPKRLANPPPRPTVNRFFFWNGVFNQCPEKTWQ